MRYSQPWPIPIKCFLRVWQYSADKFVSDNRLLTYATIEGWLFLFPHNCWSWNVGCNCLQLRRIWNVRKPGTGMTRVHFGNPFGRSNRSICHLIYFCILGKLSPESVTQKMQRNSALRDRFHMLAKTLFTPRIPEEIRKEGHGSV